MEVLISQMRRSISRLEFALMPDHKGQEDFEPDAIQVAAIASGIYDALDALLDQVEGTQ
jgi:hypothetical protein